MQEQRADALVLRTVDYGEADRIVTFLTPQLGKVAMFARAARKSQKRFGGALEPFQRLELRYRESRRGALPTLAAAHIRDRRGRLIQDYARITHASYLTELVSETIREREPMPELFRALDTAYEVMNSPEYEDSDNSVRGGWIAAFELKILSLAGYQPLLDGCSDCGHNAEGAFRFHAQRGGLLCETCAHREGTPLSLGVAHRLAHSLGTEISQLRLEFSAREAFEARRALSGFIRYHLGKELRSARFVEL